MTTLDNFEVFDFSEGVPSISITQNGITFNKSVVLKLGCPEHVILLIDRAGKRIAIQECDANTPKAVPFYKVKQSNVISVRWNGRDLLNTIQTITGWDLSKSGYRVEGELLREEHAMLFELSKAVELK